MALMRRQSLVKFDAPLCETIIETPNPQGKEVLVRIERCGLCHSDLHIQDGYADLGGGRRRGQRNRPEYEGRNGTARNVRSGPGLPCLADSASR